MRQQKFLFSEEPTTFPTGFLVWIGNVEKKELKKLWPQLSEDGVDVIKELRSKGEHAVTYTEAWSLLRKDDQQAILDYKKSMHGIKWGWYIKRQEEWEA